MQANRTWIALAIALVLGGGAWVGHQVYRQHEAGNFATGESASWSLMGAGKGASADSSGTGLSGPRSPAAVRDRLFKHGSFTGTELDGSWSVVDGRLVPSLTLRNRFENYLLGLGEVTLQEIRGLVEDDARRDVGDKLAAEILVVWDKYMQLREFPFQQQFKQNDRATWSPFFDELRMVRRQVLGKVWADAFFTEEEAQFQQYLAQLETGRPAPTDPGAPVPQVTAGKDPAAVHAERVALYGEAATQRLEQADAEWADWERRFAGGKAEWERLRKAPELSAAQRQEAINRYIQSNFQDDEAVRARALLDLP